MDEGTDVAPSRAPARAAADTYRHCAKTDNASLAGCLLRSRQKAAPREGLELGYVKLVSMIPILERSRFNIGRQL
jgi:hypothetical protein